MPGKGPQYLADDFIAAHASNYSRGRGGYKIDRVIIHYIQGSADSAISWFRNPSANVSAHYVLYSSGHTVQMVSEEDMAWHVGAPRYPANNPRSVGLEHHGWGRPQDWSDAMLIASAKVTAGICHRYSIPVDRNHIVGHNEMPGATHTDPGRYFPWDKYMALVRRYAAGSGGKPRTPFKMRGINFCAPRGIDPDSDELAWHAANAVRAGYDRPHMVTPEADWGAANRAKEIRYAVDKALAEGNSPEKIQVVLIGKKAIECLDDEQKKMVESDNDASKGRILYAANKTQLAWRINNAMEQAKNATKAQRKKAVDHYREAVDLAKKDGGEKKPSPKKRVRNIYEVAGRPRYSEDVVRDWAKSIGCNKSIIDLIGDYYRIYEKLAKAHPGGRIAAPDALFIQAVHETGKGRYDGASRPYNPAGIKRADADGDSAADFEVPATPYTGAMMHFNHMAAYLQGPTHDVLHSRYPLVVAARKGKAPARTFGDLAGSWAADRHYGEKLKKYADSIEEFAGKEK